MQEANSPEMMDPRSIGDLTSEVIDKMRRIDYGNRLISRTVENHILNMRALALTMAKITPLTLRERELRRSTSIHAIKAATA